MCTVQYDHKCYIRLYGVIGYLGYVRVILTGHSIEMEYVEKIIKLSMNISTYSELVTLQGQGAWHGAWQGHMTHLWYGQIH